MKTNYKTYLVSIDGKPFPNVQRAADFLGMKKQTLWKRLVASDYNYTDIINGKKIQIKEYK